MQNKNSIAAGVALAFLCACGSSSIDIGTVNGPADSAPGTTDDAGTGAEDADDNSSDDIDNIVTPIACDGTNSSATLARFSYAPGYQPTEALMQQVRDTLATMTLTEKANQMRGFPYGTAGSPNFTDTQRSLDTKTIRGFRYRDGTRGMNLGEDMDGSTPNAGKVNGMTVGYSTAFPVSVARGASFDLSLEYAIGEAIGDEMQAAKETVLLAPSVDLLRNPLWGRAQESYGEDPFHLGRMGSAMAVGIQQHIAAAAVHYTGYNIENGRDFNDVAMDDQTLREMYGRQFRMVAQDAGVASILASYNMVNGTKSAMNRHTLTDVLRSDFGFQGFVVSDWWALPPQANVDVDTGTLKAYALQALTAGLDVEMPWALDYGQLENIVNSNGGLTLADIDRSAGRVLMQKFRFKADGWDNVGLGTPKTTYSNSRIGNDGDHISLAKRAALESMVLLKNAGDVLPIPPTVKKVVVLGATATYQAKNSGRLSVGTVNFATDVLTGDMGSSRVFHDPAKGIGPYAGIKKTAPAGVSVVAGSSASDATDADFIVVIAGLTAGEEGEEYTLAGDRTSLALDAKQANHGVQDNLIASAAALGKPMVVVLEGGSVIDMPWLAQVPAVVMAWYPGMVGGEAMGMLLWGQANFSGKLPISWGRLSDYPGLKSANGATNLDYYVGYRYFDKNEIVPLFPFGYGLSYTSFEYRKLQLGCSEMAQGAVLPVVVNVANTGSRAGDETVMVFVSFPGSASRRPLKELKGFARVHLEPGQEKQITVPIRLQDLDYFRMAADPTGSWVVETGQVDIMVGGSSTDGSSTRFPLVGQVMVNGYTSPPS